MSKKSKFSNFAENKNKNEFEEKAEEEEELEENELSKKEKNNNIEQKKDKDIKEDPFDISDDEDEVQDKISDLNSVPNYFEIPKPIDNFKPPLPPSGENPLLKKYEPLDWHKAFPITYNICDNTIPIYIHGEQGPNIICLHGAGHSGLSFAPLALINKDYRIISFDFRGHGFNTQSPYNDFSEKTLINDTMQVLNHIHEKYPEENLILLGHSMGGSIATKTIESARISVPPLLKEEKNEKTGKTVYKFKTNLLDSKPFWNEWFIGLTKAFLSCNIPKMLMLAGIERMDKDLTIAQMQGKYKLSIMRNVGHIMHEDKPDEAMKFIKEFVKTFRITAKETEMKPIIGKLGNQDPNQKVIVPLKYDKWNANK